MAEGMEVDLVEEGPGPSSSGVKNKKRFEVKKVFYLKDKIFRISSFCDSGMR